MLLHEPCCRKSPRLKSCKKVEVLLQTGPSLTLSMLNPTITTAMQSTSCQLHAQRMHSLCWVMPANSRLRFSSLRLQSSAHATTYGVVGRSTVHQQPSRAKISSLPSSHLAAAPVWALRRTPGWAAPQQAGLYLRMQQDTHCLWLQHSAHRLL